MNQDIQERLEAALPQETYANTIRGVQEGIFLADDLIDNAPVLSALIGRDLRGQIRRAGVMFRLHELCRIGDLPFGAEFSQMPLGHWHWLEIRSGGVKGHVIRTESKLAFPANTPNRQDERLRNQYDLFEDNVIRLAEIADNVGALYAWLVIGATREGQLTHVCWNIPAAGNDEWLAHVDLLESARGELPSPSSPAPTPDPRKDMRFREHIEEALKKDKSDKPESD